MIKLMSHLIHLRTFLEVYRSKSFSKAAENLAITQPAASLHIQSLESFIGIKLFIRQSRGVEPTTAADELARSIAPNIDALEFKLSSFKLGNIQGGTIHLVAPADFLYYCLTKPLASLMTQGFNIRCQTGNRQKIYDLLKEQSIDLAITASKPDEQQYNFLPLVTEKLYLVHAPSLSIKIGKKPNKEVLSQIPLIAYDEDLPLVRSVWSTLFESPIHTVASCIVPDLRAIKELVIAGHGWSVLPDYHCEHELKEGALIALNNRNEAPTNQLYLVWSKGLQKTNINFVRDYLTNFFHSNK
ncbi:LysR family transcriptional regulator [Acinetobacter sichuanensis]|uniref:LysR family transcriptional regulator n=1 Tax=Acinetobacter sichuanensis TaxID=2136183 RepID=A0A371YNG4_9GAMM|nr:LysR family transcriptional regulator [Acinetobacter sichuanensis]RFC82992.1 LysR family transcriptional regulator [Acinetobacter sichuanensis]